jgi:methylated-DNA-[protein]-cysteine S-methyltransferase
LSLYFLGQRTDFDEPLDLQGATHFQARVWSIVRAIPYGQVRSYGWVAAQARSPRAARAVGQVMANNPFPIIVPCHRVVGQAGGLTGFGAMEGVVMAGNLV